MKKQVRVKYFFKNATFSSKSMVIDSSLERQRKFARARETLVPIPTEMKRRTQCTHRHTKSLVAEKSPWNEINITIIKRG